MFPQKEWAEAKKELQEERSNARNSTSDRNQTLNNAVRQVEGIGKEFANALKAVSAAESRASVAEVMFKVYFTLIIITRLMNTWTNSTLHRGVAYSSFSRSTLTGYLFLLATFVK